MATQVQFRGGTTTEHASFNGVAKEVTVDTTKQTLVVQDGSTNGGFPLMRENGTQSLVTTGDITSGNFFVPDSKEIRVGNTLGDPDLKIYHSSSNYIQADNGNIIFWADGVGRTVVLNSTTGACDLHYGGATNPSLETTAGGAKCTGLLESDAIHTNYRIGIGAEAADFGSGISTLLLQGRSSSKAGCIDFKEYSSGTRLANIFVQNDSTYGMSIGTSCSGEAGDFIRFHTNALGTEALRLDASQNATFGGNISVNGGSNTTQATFTGTAARGLKILTESGGAADEGVIFNAQASGTTAKMKFQTNSVTALTLAGNGGNATFEENLYVKGGTAADIFRTTSTGTLISGLGNEQRFVDTTVFSATSGTRKGAYIFNDGATDNCYASLELAATNGNDYFGSTILSSIASGSYANDFVIQTRHAAAYKESLRISSEGHATLAGNLSLAAGMGLNFGANSDGSRSVITGGNLFDDYEEGTFNPQLGGATNHGTHEISGGATYTKIGRKVYMQISFQSSDLNNSAAGQVLIKNLPFTFVDTVVNSSHTCAGISCDFATTNVTMPDSGDMNRYVWQLIAADGQIKGYIANDGGGMTDWDASNFTAYAMELRLNITGLTAT